MRLLPDTVLEAERLGTDPAIGLRGPQVAQNRLRYGENRLPPIRGRSFLSMVLAALGDKTILVLIGAATVALFVEWGMGQIDPGHAPHYIDGVAIWIAVLIATLVSAGNEARAAKEFASLARQRDDIPVKVRRSDEVSKVPVAELVVGDLVLLEAGDRVPGDGLVLSSVDLELDQSMLTGESEPVEKGAEDPELKAGSVVTAGTGSFLVTAVGQGSELGKLHEKLAAPEEGETPLQERLSKLADRIGLFGLGAAILTFGALAISGFARGELANAAALEVARELMNEGSSEDEAWSLLDELSRMPASQDSLGLGSVVYWPGVPWPQDEEHSCPHPWHEEGGPEACPRCESDGQDEPGCGSCPKCGSLAPQNCGHWDRDGNPAADPG